MQCASCDARIPEAARFCPECGAPQHATPDERRIVTVLMADIVGFTARSEHADPESVKTLVDRCFERLVADVTAHGGRLDKIVGDQIVATFGTPIAHEDDAERAVRAALAMRRTLDDLPGIPGEPVRIRIGINTGEVLVGAMRSGGDATVMGDVVNTASRLESACEPGEILVGPDTWAASRHAIHYEAVGPLTVRGRGAAVETWRAVEAITAPGRRIRLRDAAPLVGRDRELETLDHVVDRAVAHDRAQLVVLVGDAGIGKTRLLIEVGRRAAGDRDAVWLHGHCAPYGETEAWGPIASVVRDHLGLDASAAPAETRAALRDGLASLLALDRSETELDRLTEGLLHLLATEGRVTVDPSRAREEALRALVRFLEGLTRRGPVVLGISDVHWADDALVGLLESLLDRLRQLPVVVLLTARPTDDGWRFQVRRHDVLVLHLDPLDTPATDALIRSMLGAGVPSAVVTQLRERSGGNPFFVEELAALLHDETGDDPNLVIEAGGGADDGDDGRDGGDRLVARLRELPATLRGLVAAHLDALPTDERRRIEICAVIGTTGPVRAVAALAADKASGAGATDPVWERLVDRDLLAIDGETFRFTSELVRDVAYATLSRAERARRHAAMAAWIDRAGPSGAEQLAHHLAEAAEHVRDVGAVEGVPPDITDRATSALADVARRAADSERFLTAVRLWDRVLAFDASDPAVHRRALVGRAVAATGTRDLARAEDDARRALDDARGAGDVDVEAAALAALGGVLHARSDYDGADDVFARAEHCFRAVGDEGGVADARRGRGIALLFRGDTDAAERLFSEALASYRSIGDARGEAWALQNLAWISFNRVRTAEATERLQQSADRFVELGDWGGLGWAIGLLAWVQYQQGNLDEAAELATSIIEEARSSGNRWAEGMMGVLLANVAMWRGDLAGAIDEATAARDLFRRIGDRWGEARATVPIAFAEGLRSRRTAHDAAVAELDDLAAALADPDLKPTGPAIAAAVLARRGDGEGALAALRRRDQPADVYRSEHRATTALALLLLGRFEEAVPVLDRALAAVSDVGPRAALGGLAGLGHLAIGDTAGAATLTAELASLGGGTYHDRILAAWTAGFVAARTGDDRTAEIELTRAVEIAAATDARVDRAVAALARAVGLRTIGHAGAPEAARVADAELDRAGIARDGWEALFTAAIGATAPAGT